MSAWIVSEKHIVTLASEYLIHVKQIENPTVDQIKKIARIIWKENINSVNHRYNEKYRISFSRNKTVPPSNLPVIGILKQIDCWEYQTSEIDDYQAKKGYKMMKELYDTLISKYNLNIENPEYKSEYNKYRWGI